jgi:hypothetical protein
MKYQIAAPMSAATTISHSQFMSPVPVVVAGAPPGTAGVVPGAVTWANAMEEATDRAEAVSAVSA